MFSDGEWQVYFDFTASSGTDLPRSGRFRSGLSHHLEGMCIRMHLLFLRLDHFAMPLLSMWSSGWCGRGRQSLEIVVCVEIPFDGPSTRRVRLIGGRGLIVCQMNR